MTNPADQRARSHDLSAKVARPFQCRAQLARERLTGRLKSINASASRPGAR